MQTTVSVVFVYFWLQKWFMRSMRLSIYGCTGEVGRAGELSGSKQTHIKKSKKKEVLIDFTNENTAFYYKE